MGKERSYFSPQLNTFHYTIYCYFIICLAPSSLPNPHWRQTYLREEGKHLFIAHAATDNKFSMLISQQISFNFPRLRDIEITREFSVIFVN